jgi:hypothetical protein
VSARAGQSHDIAFLDLEVIDFDGRWHPLTPDATLWNGVVG